MIDFEADGRSHETLRCPNGCADLVRWTTTRYGHLAWACDTCHDHQVVPRRRPTPERTPPSADLPAPNRPGRRATSRDLVLQLLPASSAAAIGAHEIAHQSGLSHGSVTSVLAVLKRRGIADSRRITNPLATGWRSVVGYWRVA